MGSNIFFSEKTSLSSVRVLGILVVYYDQYYDQSIAEFKDLLLAISQHAKTIIVRNNRELQVRSTDVEVEDWDNREGEFGAWNHVLATLSEDEYDWVVFGNDTFCHHHIWDADTKIRFLRAISARNLQTAHAIGYEDFTCQAMELSGNRISSWLSTYLFALNSLALDSIGWTLDAGDEFLSQVVHPNVDTGELIDESKYPQLGRHVNGWLLRTGGKARWYKAERLNEGNISKMETKARAIVNELHLSTQLRANNVVITNMNDSQMPPFHRSLRCFLAWIRERISKAYDLQ